ncbi:MAG: acyl-ACP--UDP-N-acetylglucosamine O-acyltransferase [Desulfovibrio sp.]|jgi:UDP-N-acetylglucosamine acyltransferase|nr:acyl-ACP--UDP-N-acetylglucosamine O-acyltransferase [Desulfovibrio sp.]
MNAVIHPSAFVSDKARIGERVGIGPCAVVEDDVYIGDDCEIRAFASVGRHTRMGRGNIVHSYAFVGGIPQDLKFRGEESRLEIGDNNNFREFCTVHRGTEGGGGVTRLGSNNLIMAYCHVAHDCILGDNIVMSNGATLAGHVRIADHVVMGGLSAVHQFSRLGRYSFVGGMTGISLDLPPYMMAVGVRGGIQGPNLIGMRRMKLPSPTITAVRAAFRLIWLSGLPRREALERAAADFADVPEAVEIIDFICESERGVLQAARSADVRDE